jgi:uncharacterized membrane protein
MGNSNPENRKWGIIYYNKNDSRFIVPRQIESLGWTINFAHTKATIGFILILVVIIFWVSTLNK